jgi:hypothetical protein
MLIRDQVKQVGNAQESLVTRMQERKRQWQTLTPAKRTEDAQRLLDVQKLVLLYLLLLPLPLCVLPSRLTGCLPRVLHPNCTLMQNVSCGYWVGLCCVTPQRVSVSLWHELEQQYPNVDTVRTASQQLEAQVPNQLEHVVLSIVMFGSMFAVCPFLV